MYSLTMDDTTRKPWDQMEGESDLWYGRFRAYLLMGTKRSVNAVFRKENNKKQQETTMFPGPTWYEAVKQWNWEERAKRYDKYQRDEEDKIIAQEKEKVLRSGFALMHKRVKELDKLSNDFIKMTKDYDKVWIPETKTIVNGKETVKIEKVVFNHQLFQLIDKYFDSIAKEKGERVKKQELDVKNSDDTQELYKAIEQALEQFPEAKIALAEKLAEMQNEQSI